MWSDTSYDQMHMCTFSVVCGMIMLCYFGWVELIGCILPQANLWLNYVHNLEAV